MSLARTASRPAKCMSPFWRGRTSWSWTIWSRLKRKPPNLIFAIETRKWSWRQAKTLAQVVSGEVNGRPDKNAISVFKSLGVALEDVAVARVVYEKAKAQSVGRPL